MPKDYTASTVLAYSPRKARLIIDEIRGMELAEAMNHLTRVNKKSSKKIHDLLKSAANNLSLTEGDHPSYKIDKIVAEDAYKLYRIRPRARGSAFRIRRRYSRIKVTLAEKK